MALGGAPATPLHHLTPPPPARARQVVQANEGWLPVMAGQEGQQVAVMSIAFLLQSTKEAVVWRGPKKNAMIKQVRLEWRRPSPPPPYLPRQARVPGRGQRR